MTDTKAVQPDFCKGCAICCKWLLLGVEGQSPEDVQYWGTIGHMVGRVAVISQVCRQLCGDKCSIYDVRPRKCRDFPVDGPACRLMRKTLGEINGTTKATEATSDPE